MPEKVILPWEAVNSARKNIELEKANGEISTNIIIPYPPGMLLPCEKVDSSVIEYLRKIIQSGGKVIGINNGLIWDC